MSESCDEYYTVYWERRRRARKQHKCCACDEPIAPGHVYMYISYVFDHEAGTYKRCLRCQTIHEHLRTLGGGDMWPAERLDCGEDYEPHWDRPPPAEIAALAFLTADEIQGLPIASRPKPVYP